MSDLLSLPAGKHMSWVKECSGLRVKGSRISSYRPCSKKHINCTSSAGAVQRQRLLTCTQLHRPLVPNGIIFVGILWDALLWLPYGHGGLGRGAMRGRVLIAGQRAGNQKVRRSLRRQSRVPLPLPCSLPLADHRHPMHHMNRYLWECQIQQRQAGCPVQPQGVKPLRHGAGRERWRACSTGMRGPGGQP